DGQIPWPAGTFDGTQQGVLLATVEPARPRPLLGNGPWAAPRAALSRNRKAGSDACRSRPGQEALQGGKLAVDAAGLELPLLDQPSLELPQVGRRDLGRCHRLPVHLIEPAGEGGEITTVVLDRQRAALGLGQETGEALDRVRGTCHRYTSSISGDRDPNRSVLYVESARKSTYNMSYTPCGGH